MKKKMGIMVLVLLLAVGFAAVSTTLIINGNTAFAPNSSDFDVYFSSASIDGVENNALISQDGKSITYETADLQVAGDISTLDYVVTNNSSQYNANVSVICDFSGNDYVTLVNSLQNDIIEAKSEKSGTLTATLIKTSTEERSQSFTCTVTASATERDTAAEVVPDEPKTQITYSDTDNSGTRNIGDIVTISKEGASTEQFYILSDNGTNTQMMSMYNLYVGGEYVSAWTAYTNATGIQDSTMLGYHASNSSISRGTTVFSNTSVSYSGSIVEGYVNNYSSYLTTTLEVANTATIISKPELETILGQSLSAGDLLSSAGGKAFLYSTSYWTRSSENSERVWNINSDGNIGRNKYSYNTEFGVRPVITISSSLL